ncbi:MAG: hypothetical protein NC483_00880 [Ruminococcus sp.]|nr:hypothetical protein [Ruminococcus sp.]
MSNRKLVEDIKNCLKYTIRSGKKSIRKNKKVSDLPMDEYVNQMVNDKQKLMVGILSMLGKIDMYELRENTENVVNGLMDKVQIDVDKVQTVYDALTVDGFNKVTYGLPRVIITCINNSSFFSSLVLSGIKINGETLEFDERLMDDNERELKHLERQMATFIASDLTIHIEYLDIFMALYKKYIMTYIDNAKKDKLYDYKGADELLFIVFLGMRNYIRFGYQNDVKETNSVKNSLDDYVKEGEIINICPLENFEELLKETNLAEETKNRLITKMTLIISSEEELTHYIKDGRVERICDLEHFKFLLDNSLIVEYMKKEYLKQMINLTHRKEQEEKDLKLEELKNELLDNQESELYAMAKRSGNIEATQLIKEIDAILELLLEVTEEEEQNSLRDELSLYFSYLNVMFNSQEEASTISSKVLYYKNESLVPVILPKIEGTSKGEYKQIYNDLNKISSGNVGNDPLLKGTGLSIPVYIKGKKFKIFYMIINGFILIIDGGLESGATKDVLSVVKTNEFKNYLGELQNNLNNGIVYNEAPYEEMILNELKKSERVRQIVTLS